MCVFVFVCACVCVCVCVCLRVCLRVCVRERHIHSYWLLIVNVIQYTPRGLSSVLSGTGPPAALNVGCYQSMLSSSIPPEGLGLMQDGTSPYRGTGAQRSRHESHINPSTHTHTHTQTHIHTQTNKQTNKDSVEKKCSVNIV